MTSTRRFPFTRLALTLHRWAGLVGAAVFLLVGTSGAVLVFHADLDRALFPSLYDVDPRAGEVSYQRAVERVRARYPDARIRGLGPLAFDRPSPLRVRAEPADGSASIVAIVDPHDGELRAIRRYGEGATRLREDPMSWLYLFHYTLTAGKAGQVVTVLSALLLLVSALSGAFVYRKQLLRVLTFRERLRTKNLDTLLSSLHRLFGVWSLVLLVLLSLTGVWMLRGTFSASFFERGARKAPPPPAPAEVTYSYDDALAAARRALPGLEPSYVSLRETRGDDGATRAVYGVLGRVHGDSALYGDYGATVRVDGNTLEVLGKRRPADKPLADKLSALAFPLHQGHWGGLPVKLLYVLAGLALPSLAISGPLLALRRQRRREGALR